MPCSDKLSDALRNSIHMSLGGEVIAWELVQQGGNSSVYRLSCEDGGRYALKQYPPLSVDPRNRLGVEFGALRFLRDSGETQVPVPVVELNGHNAGVYQWIEGVPPRRYTAADIGDAVSFLDRLHSLTATPGAQRLAYASEAALSYQQIKQQLHERWKRLADHAHSNTALQSFLLQHYTPRAQQILDYLDTAVAKSGVFTAPTPREKLTLSPSDFGFHNAIKRLDAGLVYVDFEYFGWDDPAKLIADFLWHPGMKLAGELKQQFVRGVVPLYRDDELSVRLKILYPLSGLRWCLIMLNEFLPDGRAKRQHSGKLKEEYEADMQSAQLSKAEHTLAQVMNTYKQFPYVI